MRLENKIGIVSAAASGMGRAGALRFAREGAAVGVVDIDQAGVEAVVGEIAAAGGRALALVGDLPTTNSRGRSCAAPPARLAGSTSSGTMSATPVRPRLKASTWRISTSRSGLNLRTVLVTTEAAIPELRARGGGALLYTASTSGLVGSAFSPVYSMAKFGVVGFVRSLAKRLAPEKIRVNAICPGPIDTPMLRVFVARPDQQRTAGEDKEALVQMRGRQNPMGRTGKPEEIANAALFLISDEASFVSGAALPVDGAATA